MSASVIEGTLTLPLSAQIQSFITAYLESNDLEKAAVAAGYQPEMGRVLYKRRLIRAEIDRRKSAVEAEVHHQIAKRRIVTVDALDRSLMKVVRLSKADIKVAPSLAAPVVRAIELGYQRTGILIDGNFIPDAGTEANKPDEAPRIFRATEQSIITHQITETRQTVTTRAVEASQGAAKPSEPPTIDAPQDDPWAKF